MNPTPFDIQHQQFSVRFRGFDIQEVDVFLEQLAKAFESMQNENMGSLEKIQQFETEIREYKEREETFKKTFDNSQKTMEQMQENSRKSAELIIADAEVKAGKLLNRAHTRLAQLHEDIAELKRQRMKIELQIRSVIETHSKLLELGIEEAKTRDEEDARVKVLKQADA